MAGGGYRPENDIVAAAMRRRFEEIDRLFRSVDDEQRDSAQNHEQSAPHRHDLGESPPASGQCP